MNHKVYNGILALILLVLSACSSQKGPCDWDYIRVEIEVLDLVPFEVEDGDEKLYHILVSFNGSLYAAEDQNLDELLGLKVTKEDIEKSRIRIGTRYKGLVSEVKTGNCKSPVLSVDSKIIL